MTTLTEAPRPCEAIISEAPGFRSRDPITIMQSQTLLANQVIGRSATAATVAAAVAGAANTGNGTVTLGAPAFGGAVLHGTYRITFVQPVTNLGTFIVEGPEGKIVGRGVVGTAFSGPIVFTIGDGATDFVAGDEFTIAVSAITYQWGAYDPAATDGRAVPAGVLFGPITTDSGVTVLAVGFVRGIEVNSQKLQWLTGLTNTQKATAIAALTAGTPGIIVRT